MSRVLSPHALRSLCRFAPGAHATGDVVTFGTDAIDGRIGGLPRGALHEVFAATIEDGGAAAGFAVMIGMRAQSAGRPVIWIRETRCGNRSGHPHAAGLRELGLDPDDLVLVDAPDTLAVLRTAVDVIRCDGVGAIVIEPWGKAPALDLTASRRLSMAAAASGVMTLVLRVDAEPVSSAAQTRWQVAAAPSIPFAADAPGHPAFDLTLLRHRGGMPGFGIRLEWNRDTRRFERPAPLPGGISTVPADRTDPILPSDQRRVA